MLWHVPTARLTSPGEKCVMACAYSKADITREEMLRHVPTARLTSPGEKCVMACAYSKADITRGEMCKGMCLQQG